MAEERPLKVLLVCSHPVQYAAPLFRLYSRDPRLDVTVAYCSLQGAEPGVDPEFGIEVAWDVPLLEGYRWIHPPNRSPRPGLGGFWGLLNPGLWPLIMRGQFDVVVCYGWRKASYWIAALAAKAARADLIWTNDAPTLRKPGMSEWSLRFKRKILRLICAIGDGALAPSSPAAHLFVALGVPESRVHLVPFSFDLARFSAGSPAGLRHRFDTPENAFVVLSVGKLVPRKRPDDVIRAAVGLDDIHVWLAGEGRLRGYLEDMSTRLAPGRIHFLGFRNQTELPNLYAAADCLAVCSDYDPFPVVVMEAMAAGLPVVVSSSVGSIGDLVRPGLTGCVYPLGDVGGFRTGWCG